MLLTAMIMLGAIHTVDALDNGIGRVPIMGWTSWITTNQGDLWIGSPYNVSAAALVRMGHRLVNSGLKDVGYEYVLLDDGWPACAKYTEKGGCALPSPRLENGDVLVDTDKFPPSKPGANDGIKLVADQLHALGLKMGIYTAPHGLTCGGYWGMLGHEAEDAKMYANWGIDFIKLDLGCQSDTSIHDGTAIASLTRVRDGLNATGRPIIYYVDAGNPTAAGRIYNPNHRGMPNDLFTQTHIANSLHEAVWTWGPDIAHMWKIWFDRHDTFDSLLGNVAAQTGLEWFHGPGKFVNTDMMTIGRGAMTDSQYRVEIFLYAILSSPMVLSFDLATLDHPNQTFAKSMLLNKNIIAINQDKDGIAGSKIFTYGRNPIGTEVWIKPLSDGSFAVALLNIAGTETAKMSLFLDGSTNGDFFAGQASGTQASIYDVETNKSLGVYTNSFNITVHQMDGRLLRVEFMPSVVP